MESQLQQSHETHGLDNLTASDRIEDEHHGEKKSVMTKVKDKARKLKKSIMKQKSPADQEIHHQDDENDDVDDDDDEDDDENYQETAEYLEVQGASVHDSAKVGQGGPEPRGNLERPPVTADDAKPVASSHGLPPQVPTGVHGFALSQPSGPGHNQGYGKELNSGNLETPSAMEDETYSEPLTSQGIPLHVSSTAHGTDQGYDQEVKPETLKGGIGHSTEVTDPSILGSDNPTNTGDKQELSELQHSFDNMGIDSEPKTLDHNYPENQPHQTLTENAPAESNTYASKISSSAFAAKDVVASKLGYSAAQTDSEPKTLDHNQPENLPRETLTENPPAESNTYAGKISSSAFAAKDAIASKLGYPAQTDSEPKTLDHNAQENLPRETLAEQPSTESNTYAGKLSSSAFAAKDAVSSWFGGKGEPPEGTLGTSNVTDKGLSSNPTEDQKKLGKE